LIYINGQDVLELCCEEVPGPGGPGHWIPMLFLGNFWCLAPTCWMLSMSHLWLKS